MKNNWPRSFHITFFEQHLIQRMMMYLKTSYILNWKEIIF